jgi:hypothetical protein
MSKFKKKTVSKRKPLEKEEDRFVKSLEFSGWIFLLILAGYIALWVAADYILNISSIIFNTNAYSFTFVVFTGTSSAFSFGLASNIKNNPEKKRMLFLDWIIGEFIFCVFAIFALAAYQW